MYKPVYYHRDHFFTPVIGRHPRSPTLESSLFRPVLVPELPSQQHNNIITWYRLTTRIQDISYPLPPTRPVYSRSAWVAYSFFVHTTPNRHCTIPKHIATLLGRLYTQAVYSSDVTEITPSFRRNQSSSYHHIALLYLGIHLPSPGKSHTFVTLLIPTQLYPLFIADTYSI